MLRHMLRNRTRSAFVLVSVLLLSAFVGLAQAQQVVISPHSIVVNPLPSFEMSVWVDKDTSGQGSPSYAVGESIRVSVRPSEDAYVYLFSIGADGYVTQILPNDFDNDGRNAFVRANTTRTFPPANARYTFNVDAPTGLAKVIAVASRRALNTETLARFRSGDFLATSNIGEEGFAGALRIIVSPLPQTDWVTATAHYYVGSRPSLGAYGRLAVSSEPRGAEVYVDRSFVGYTPLNYGLRPGTYDVEIVGNGGRHQERVRVTADRTTDVFASLRPAVRTGTATFTSQPSGAEVYVGGSYVGTTPTAAVGFDVGSYEAEFVRAGYTTERVRFDVRADRDTRVSAQMRGQRGSLEILANVGGARVFINGSEVGTIANGTGRFIARDLEAGSYEVLLVAPGYRSVIQEVQVGVGQSATVTMRQTRR